MLQNEKKLYGSITDNDLREYYLKVKNIKKNDDISDLANKKIFFLLKSKFKKYNKSLLKKNSKNLNLFRL